MHHPCPDAGTRANVDKIDIGDRLFQQAQKRFEYGGAVIREVLRIVFVQPGEVTGLKAGFFI
jgi:hypothetical protein